MVVDITNIVTYTNFGDRRLRGFWVVGRGGGQISPFPIDFDRRPYNTLALPCECVMSVTAATAMSAELGTLKNWLVNDTHTQGVGFISFAMHKFV